MDGAHVAGGADGFPGETEGFVDGIGEGAAGVGAVDEAVAVGAEGPGVVAPVVKEGGVGRAGIFVEGVAEGGEGDFHDFGFGAGGEGIGCGTGGPAGDEGGADGVGGPPDGEGLVGVEKAEARVLLPDCGGEAEGDAEGVAGGDGLAGVGEGGGFGVDGEAVGGEEGERDGDDGAGGAEFGGVGLGDDFVWLPAEAADGGVEADVEVLGEVAGDGVVAGEEAEVAVFVDFVGGAVFGVEPVGADEFLAGGVEAFDEAGDGRFGFGIGVGVAEEVVEGLVGGGAGEGFEKRGHFVEARGFAGAVGGCGEVFAAGFDGGEVGFVEEGPEVGVEAVDEFGAEFDGDGGLGGAEGGNAASDAVAGFEDEGGEVALAEVAGGGEAGDAGAEDEEVGGGGCGGHGLV